MNPPLLTVVLALCGTPLLAQTPAAPVAHANDLGFSYSLPSDWEVVGAQPTLPDLKEKQSQSATTEEEKKGIACVQMALTARHGAPPSIVVVMALPFDCFGESMSDKDLPGFAQGASQGLEQSFDVSDPVYGAYSLGTHSMWIERVKGNPKGHPELKYTVEVTCSLLKKSAVCWMAMAADDRTLHIFENGATILDGETAPALVPASAFDKKPAA